MKKLFNLLFLFPVFLYSCKQNELTKEQAFPLIASYYGFSINNATNKTIPSQGINEAYFETQIAIDQRIDDYGWPPQKYELLQKKGIIDVYYEQRGFLGGVFVASVGKLGNKYFINSRTWDTPVEGRISQFIFKGYRININDVNISSNARDKSAMAEVTFSISDISPIQEIVSPLKSNFLKSTVYFKLFDKGWQVIDDQKSHIKINKIDNPLHWAEQ